MKKSKKLYIRLDYKFGKKRATHQDILDHMTYVKNISKERYFMGGVFLNAKKGNTSEGMCLFEAENLEEAEKITQNDPIIKKGFYQSEIFEWNLVVVSEDIKECFPIRTQE